MMAEADVNRDGKINYEEFLRVMEYEDSDSSSDSF